jgi:SulP family sulfate permease
VRDVSSGILTAIVSLAYTLSCAALIFSGPLSYGLSVGVAASLIAMATCMLATALLGPFPRAIAGVDGNAAAVLAAMAAAMALSLGQSGTPPGPQLVTVMAAIAIATLCTAMLLAFLGFVRGARWVRIIPYPVMGGFIAAVGWLLVVGSVRVATGMPATAANAAGLTHGTPLAQLIATVALAAALIVAARRIVSAAAISLVLVAAVAIGDTVLGLLPGGLHAAAAAGWFPLANDRAGWSLWYLNLNLHDIAWPAIWQVWPEIVTVAAISTITILINATAFELVSQTDADLDAQLRADGIGNIASLVLGGFVGYFALARSVLNVRLGAKGRLSGYTVAAIGAALVFAGSSIGRYVPVYLLAGLLLYIGYTMLDTWIVKTRRPLPALEWVALLIIVVVIVSFGFFYGIIAGLVACTAIFAFNYSRTTAIASVQSGAQYRSTLVRSPSEFAALVEHGDEIRAIALHGFLFFAVADRLYRRFLDTVIDGKARFAILDFSRVNGIDAAAATSFVKMARAADRADVAIAFAAMSDGVARQWAAAAGPLDDGVKRFTDLDHAMEWGEDQLIERYATVPGDDPTLRGWLETEFGDAGVAARLVAVLQRREIAAGETLCREGEAADSMFFIESGHIGIVVRRDDGSMQRLRSLGEHTMLGEMGLYRQTPRSASAVAEKPSVVFELTREAFANIERADPELAGTIHRTIVRTLSDRLSFQNVLLSRHV